MIRIEQLVNVKQRPQDNKSARKDGMHTEALSRNGRRKGMYTTYLLHSHWMG